jgi:hypothetical protein
MIKLYGNPKIASGGHQRVPDQRVDHAIEPVPKNGFPHAWLAFVNDEQCWRMALPVLRTVLPIRAIDDQWYFVVRS